MCFSSPPPQAAPQAPAPPPPPANDAPQAPVLNDKKRDATDANAAAAGARRGTNSLRIKMNGTSQGGSGLAIPT